MERRDKISIGEGLCTIIAGITVLILFGQGPYLYWPAIGIISIVLGLFLIIYTVRTLDRGS